MRNRIIEMQERLLGVDFLAYLAITGALITKEFFAAAVIVLMLITGRFLERWAEGQAERQLKSLLSRMPRQVHRLNTSGLIEEIPMDHIAVGDVLLADW